MHEYAFTESLLELAVQKAQNTGTAKITRINVILGEISGIVDECVWQAFEIIKQNTLASGAELAFTNKPVLLKCRQCGREFKPAGHRWECPICYEANVEIVSGRDCYLESIEVE